MELFNTREQALIILVSVGFLIVFLREKNVRYSFFNVIKAAFNIHIFAVFGAMGIYLLAVVSLLYKLNLWRPILVKDTFMWVLFTGIVLLLNINKNVRKEGFFKSLLIDAIKITFLFEFLVNFYTFSLIGEIVLQFVLLVLFGMKAVADTNEKYKVIVKPINYLLTAFGIYIGLYLLGNIIVGLQGLISEDNRISLILSPLLTISYIPFLYLIALFFTYNEFFKFLEAFLKQDTILASYAKRKILIYFNFNLLKLNHFLKDYRSKAYKIKNRDELILLLQEFESEQLKSSYS